MTEMTHDDADPASASVAQTAPGAPPGEPPVEVLPLNEAMLDDDQLAQLFTDIELATEVLEVRLKGGDVVHSVAGTTLADARQNLAAQTVPAAQIRYAYRGQQWIDTLMRTPLGVKLIRAPLPPQGTRSPSG